MANLVTVRNDSGVTQSLYPFGGQIFAGASLTVDTDTAYPLFTKMLKLNSALTVTAGAFPSNAAIDAAIKSFIFAEPQGASPTEATQVTKINALAAFTTAALVDIADIRTKYAAAVTLANEQKADYNFLRATVTDLRTKYATAITLANEAKADHNALLAKLDADAGVTDVDYAALHTTAAADLAALAADGSSDTAAADVAAAAAATAAAVVPIP